MGASSDQLFGNILLASHRMLNSNCGILRHTHPRHPAPGCPGGGGQMSVPYDSDWEEVSRLLSSKQLGMYTNFRRHVLHLVGRCVVVLAEFLGLSINDQPLRFRMSSEGLDVWLHDRMPGWGVDLRCGDCNDRARCC